jgi:hypothetical protein
MSENTSENTVQVALDGSVLLVHRDDVVRDSGGKVSGVRPRGHCNGSETRHRRFALGRERAFRCVGREEPE